MHNFFLLLVLSVTLLACERQDRPSNSHPMPKAEDSDNTGRNVRDRDSMTKTPLDQSENEADLAITQKIRQALISNEAFSTNAKNIKIITINGVVTLRGPVLSLEEKEAIVQKLHGIQGIIKVENQLEVTNKK